MAIAVPVTAESRSKNYGFIIDNRKCIGCHACSTACKSENEVPLGVYRTWVKYVETGRYPDSRRHFQVTRCNHCANPPCVRICPTQAMYQRADGIVEFDNRACIGCKACLQACPYDAIYIDPDTNTAAKCHYCAHRTEIGLEPACVVVCPEHAIIAGDLNDPQSEISRLLARSEVTVRKPEQGTAPKLFYIDGHDAALHPTATERAPQTFMWADVVPLHGVSTNGREVVAESLKVNGRLHRNGTPLRAPQVQGEPWDGPIHFGPKVAEQMVQVAYNAQHKIPWHWPVPAYLVTKAAGTGIFMILAAGYGLNWFPLWPLTAVVAGLASLLLVLLTTGLLVYDLERPERFFTILLRPQWQSWLTRGALFLIGFSIVGTVWWLFEIGGLLLGYELPLVRAVLLWLGLPLALGAAIYTAFLFAQAEGRDLWQTPLLPFHMLVHAIVAGSAALLILAPLVATPPALARVASLALTVSLMLSLFTTLLGEFAVPHASEVAARAAHEISDGRYRHHFWWGGILLGHGLPLLLLLVAALTGTVLLSLILPALAGVSAIAGLYLYEYAFVMAPQEIPNS
jgi:Fe-S-cluster-containing dehydrogenase component/formate-dependent nitrite reductase membrane component NrfD